MSLEALLAENTAAVKDLTAALHLANAGRDAAAEKIAAAAAKGAESGETAPAKRGRPPKAADPVAAAATPPAAKAVETVAAAPAAKAIPAPQDVRAAAAAWLDTTQDPAVRTEYKASIKAILDHLGADNLMAVQEGDRAKAIDWITRFRAGEKVNFSEGEDAPEEDDDMLG